MYNDGATVNEELLKFNQESLTQQKMIKQIAVEEARNSIACAFTGLVLFLSPPRRNNIIFALF